MCVNYIKEASRHYEIRENETYLWMFVRFDSKQVVQSPKKVQVGKDQEKAQSEKDSHSKNRGG